MARSGEVIVVGRVPVTRPRCSPAPCFLRPASFAPGSGIALSGSLIKTARLATKQNRGAGSSCPPRARIHGVASARGTPVVIDPGLDTTGSRGARRVALLAPRSTEAVDSTGEPVRPGEGSRPRTANTLCAAPIPGSAWISRLRSAPEKLSETAVGSGPAPCSRGSDGEGIAKRATVEFEDRLLARIST